MGKEQYYGQAIPLKANNVDTDQIIPAHCCYRPTRNGHGDSLFANWRQNSKFVLNDELYKGASILVAGREFATGSSREYAVWALKDYGFDVIIAPSFGDIFYKNAIINDLLPLIASESSVEAMWGLLEYEPKTIFIVDLNQNSVIADGRVYMIQIKDHFKNKYLDHRSEIELTMEHLPLIEKYEREHHPSGARKS